MKLSEWIRMNKVNKGEFAKALGIARNTLHLYERGLRQPPLDVAIRIKELTNGEVTPEDLVIKKPRKTPAGTGV